MGSRRNPSRRRCSDHREATAGNRQRIDGPHTLLLFPLPFSADGSLRNPSRHSRLSATAKPPSENNNISRSLLRIDTTKSKRAKPILNSPKSRKQEMKWGRIVSLPILAVLSLMVMVYYGTVFIFLDDWIDLQSSAGQVNAVIFTFLAFFTLFSFLVCVFTDPGGVPSGYFPDIEHSDGSDQESRDTESLKKRCDKCTAYKPPRAHHCRICRRCVLKMDHHCTWINNCVGQRNYKAFFLLVLYATVSSLHSMVLIVGCGVQKDWELDGMMSHLKTFYITSGLMISLLSLTLGTLLGWHVYLLTHNMTTIEYYEGTRAAWLARKSGQIYKHPYDVGVYRNLTVTLGPSVLKWLWPSALGHVKEGTSFPTVRDSL